jgi:hypothetical protein
MRKRKRKRNRMRNRMRGRWRERGEWGREYKYSNSSE